MLNNNIIISFVLYKKNSEKVKFICIMPINKGRSLHTYNFRGWNSILSPRQYKANLQARIQCGVKFKIYRF